MGHFDATRTRTCHHCGLLTGFVPMQEVAMSVRGRKRGRGGLQVGERGSRERRARVQRWCRWPDAVQARVQAGDQLGETARVAGKGKGCPGEQL
jgi:hypothetical protein